MNFTIELARRLIHSDEQFPVDFDLAWQWLGYTRKDSALDTLKTNFVEGVEFSGTNRETPQGGRPSRLYSLTVNCFKELAMLAKTQKGKQVRQYFLECERIAKQKTAPEPKQTTAADRANTVNQLAISLKYFGIDAQNPRFKQSIQDLVGDVLGLGQPVLESANNEVWCGVAERAVELGFPVAIVTKKRSPLGKWVATKGLKSKKEKRLCNGTQRPINLYLVSDDLDSAISDYFNQL
jgi:phage anti-repressor protein